MRGEEARARFVERRSDAADVEYVARFGRARRLHAAAQGVVQIAPGQEIVGQPAATSARPPRAVAISAQPFDIASIAERANGSCQSEGTTAISARA